MSNEQNSFVLSMPNEETVNNLAIVEVELRFINVGVHTSKLMAEVKEIWWLLSNFGNDPLFTES